MEGANLRKTFQGWYDASLEQKLNFITKGLKVNAKVSYSSSSTTSTATYLGTEAASQAFKYIIRYSRTYDYANPIIGEDGQLTYRCWKASVFLMKHLCLIRLLLNITISWMLIAVGFITNSLLLKPFVRGS